MSMRVSGSYGLSPLDWKSRVVASDVANLVLRIQIVVRIEELYRALRMVVRNLIVLHVYSTSGDL